MHESKVNIQYAECVLSEWYTVYITVLLLWIQHFNVVVGHGGDNFYYFINCLDHYRWTSFVFLSLLYVKYFLGKLIAVK